MTVFENWLQDELEYLRSQVKAEVLEQEKLEIEYYLLLIKFKESHDTLVAAKEKAFLEAREQAVSATDPALAYKICQHCLERGRYDALHISQLQRLAKDPRFTGSLAVGTCRQSPANALPPSLLPSTNEPDDPDISDDSLTDTDASGDDDNEVLEWYVKLIDAVTDR
ncbi:hypothetical protein C8J56DRAFT_1063401 [Mycena floridula]|nr:hypothetical protein C8J56DRAFT_1063401 [Mycena floridula]